MLEYYYIQIIQIIQASYSQRGYPPGSLSGEKMAWLTKIAPSTWGPSRQGLFRVCTEAVQAGGSGFPVVKGGKNRVDLPSGND